MNKSLIIGLLMGLTSAEGMFGEDGHGILRPDIVWTVSDATAGVPPAPAV